ncbi:hypothetical protein O181_005635 [Austropuccinia psidii MF-1]|uniref:Uncharacterized protein n=1 Tax=Austropuccinia psidii MF-1 TaxID=1389203 RepID=A0A9Q3BIR9_9BASI|nr:hypothetical protein [Austropuccinia psidii MF-1]
MSTFVGQVILNASTKSNIATQQLSPFVYRVVDPPISSSPHHHSQSPHPTQSWFQVADVRRPQIILSTSLGLLASTLDCPKTKGVANPIPKHPSPFFHSRPRTLDKRLPPALGSHYQ